MIFEVLVILLTILIVFILKKQDNKIVKRFWLALIGILIFEFLTHPLWINTNLESWAYLYEDVSWIITLCWVDIILISMSAIMYLAPKARESKKFIFQLILVTILGLCLEWVFLRLGIREYSSVIQGYLSVTTRIGGIIPLIELIYIPSFMALIIGFIRYWEISTDSRKSKRRRTK